MVLHKSILATVATAAMFLGKASAFTGTGTSFSDYRQIPTSLKLLTGSVEFLPVAALRRTAPSL